MRASDERDSFCEISVNIRVITTNMGPNCPEPSNVSVGNTVGAGTSLAVVTATDPDSDPLTYVILSVQGGNVSPNAFAVDQK